MGRAELQTEEVSTPQKGPTKRAGGRGGRSAALKEMHVSDVKIQQKDPIVGDVKREDRESEIVLVDPAATNKEYLDELKFNEEPITIRIEPSSEKNAAGAHPVWVNGKGAEVFQRGQWQEIGYLPVGRILIVKRKVVAVLAGAKFDNVTTEVEDATVENPQNLVRRLTSSAVSFSVLEDKNPRGRAWLTELIRRNM